MDIQQILETLNRTRLPFPYFPLHVKGGNAQLGRVSPEIAEHTLSILGLLPSKIKEDCEIDSSSFFLVTSARSLYLEVKWPFQNKVWILPDGLELLSSQPENDVLQKWVNNDYETTERRSSDKPVREINLGGKLLVDKLDPRYSDCNSFTEIENYERLNYLIHKLGLEERVRIPKLYFAEERAILLESLFDYLSLFTISINHSDHDHIQEEYEKLSLHQHFDLEPWHCFAYQEAGQYKFVVIDPHEHMFRRTGGLIQ